MNRRLILFFHTAGGAFCAMKGQKMPGNIRNNIPGMIRCRFILAKGIGVK
jgi:hypothetical protein